MGNQSNQQRKENLRQILLLAVLLPGLFILYKPFAALIAKKPQDHAVTYRVRGTTSTGVVTYTRADGQSIKPMDIHVPWDLIISYSKPTTVILTATNPSQTGSIQCELMLDGRPWKKESARAPSDKVSCAGIVP